MAKPLTKTQQNLLTNVQGAAQGEPGFFVSDRTPDLETLQARGLVDVGTLPDSAQVAVRLQGDGAAANLPNGEAKSEAAKWLNFATNMAPPPAQKGGKREEEYPWSEMNINDSFLVPVTAKAPKPWDSFATSVSEYQPALQCGITNWREA